MPLHRQSEKRYRDFHGKRPKWTEEFRFKVPKNLIVLGDAVAIEYRTDKLNGGGDGKTAVYRHEFETPAFVCMDETGKRQLYILGEDVIVTEAGIEN